MKLLGIDFGLKKIGVAISLDGWPEPVAVWERDPRLFGKLKKLTTRYGLELVVVGMPDGELEEVIKIFCQKLTLVLRMPVELGSECLTTSDAVDKMTQAGKKRQYRKKMEDAVAAALILERYLEKNNV